MGTTASLQNDGNSHEGRKAPTAHDVRQRLHNEYHNDDRVLHTEQDKSGIGLANVPSVLKAKNAFLKGIQKQNYKGSGDDVKVIHKQVCVLEILLGVEQIASLMIGLPYHDVRIPAL